jgi:hypothetical protein
LKSLARWLRPMDREVSIDRIALRVQWQTSEESFNQIADASLCALLNPLSPPIRRFKGLRKILGLVYDLAVAKLHDADRISHSPAIGDGVFRDPEIPFSLNSPDIET